MERPMNRKLAATVSVAALCICGELGRSMLRPYIVTAQDGAIAPAENLVVAGVPAIPASLVETAGRYGSYRSAALADWNSPSRGVLVALRFAGTPQPPLVEKPGRGRQPWAS